MWHSAGAGSFSPELTKPSGSGDPCVDINIQVTGAAYFQAYRDSNSEWYAGVWCTPGSPSGTTINQLTQTAFPGGVQFQVYDDSSNGEDTRIVY